MEIVKELEKCFGIRIVITDEVDKDGLPRYLVSGREIYKAQYEDFVFYIVRVAKAADSRVLSQELISYEEMFTAPIAFWFDELTKNNRNAYIKHHIPFILIPTQIYLPFMGMLFSRKLSDTKRKESLPLTANAQKILFYLIYNEKREYTKKQLAQELEMDPVYITRGTKELFSRNMISEIRRGRFTVVERSLDSRVIFETSKSALISPVNKVLFIKKTRSITGLPKASDYALSEIGMLNPPKTEAFACYKNNALINSFTVVDEPEWADPSEICKVELWNYDPDQLSNNGMVDKLSLYCTLMDSKDVRVQGELENMLEEMEWL